MGSFFQNFLILKFPNCGDENKRYGEANQIEGKPYFSKVSEAVAACTIDIGVRLVADRRRKTRRRSNAGGDDKGSGIKA